MELRGYQRFGVGFLRDAQRAILADEMGVGKTPQLIVAAEGRTLVVAPPGLHPNWKRELATWSERPDEFTVTSYHSLVDRTRKDRAGHVLGVIRPEFRQPWDTVVFDESHHLKGRHTGYARAGVKVAQSAGRVYLATGTPVRNWAHELFMLLRALYPGDPRFSSYWRWVDMWFTIDEVERWQGKRKKVVREVGKLRPITTWEAFTDWNGINGRWLRRELDDPEVDVELPPTHHIEIGVKMATAQGSAYRSMEKSFFAEYDGSTILAESHGSQFNNLMRIATGLVFHPDFLRGPSAKLDALADLVQGNEGPFLVFGWHHLTVETLARWFASRGFSAGYVHGGVSAKNNDFAIEAFKGGTLDVLVGTYSTLSEGHNLTIANKTILFEPCAVPGMIDQALARTRRFGQTRQCTVWTLVTEETMDAYYVRHMLPAKRGQARAVITAADLRTYKEGAWK